MCWRFVTTSPVFVRSLLQRFTSTVSEVAAKTGYAVADDAIYNGEKAEFVNAIYETVSS